MYFTVIDTRLCTINSTYHMFLPICTLPQVHVYTLRESHGRVVVGVWGGFKAWHIVDWLQHLILATSANTGISAHSLLPTDTNNPLSTLFPSTLFPSAAKLIPDQTHTHPHHHSRRQSCLAEVVAASQAVPAEWAAKTCHSQSTPTSRIKCSRTTTR